MASTTAGRRSGTAGWSCPAAACTAVRGKRDEVAEQPRDVRPEVDPVRARVLRADQISVTPCGRRRARGVAPPARTSPGHHERAWSCSTCTRRGIRAGGKISTCAFRRTFGRSICSAFFRAARRVLPSCAPPPRCGRSASRPFLRPSSSPQSCRPAGHPAAAALRRSSLVMHVFIADWLEVQPPCSPPHVRRLRVVAQLVPVHLSWPTELGCSRCASTRTSSRAPHRGGGWAAISERRDRAVNASNVAAAESLVASPKLSEARTFLLDVLAPLAEAWPRRGPRAHLHDRRRSRHAPSAANAPPGPQVVEVRHPPLRLLASLALPAELPHRLLPRGAADARERRAGVSGDRGAPIVFSRFAAREGPTSPHSRAGGREKLRPRSARRFRRRFFADGPETRTNTPSFQGSRTRVRPVPAT